MNKLCITNLTKIIRNRTVLDHINMTVDSGKIYGLVGKNGSGKTMLIRSISGTLIPTEGTIQWNESVLYRDIDFIPNTGVLIENIGLSQQFSGFDNLKLIAKIKKKIRDEDITEVLKKVGLDPADKQPVKKYSLGMRQKLAIAQAIMEHPDLLLLDEPTNALDDTSCQTVRTILEEEAHRGACIIIASHNQEDIFSLCHEIYTMHNGILTKNIEE